MKKHIAISTFIILLSISTALPSHALADTGQTRSDIRPAETTDNTSAYDRITTAEIVLASMFAISSAGCISLYRRKNTAPDNRPDTATHTTVTSPADDTPPDADTADTVSNGSGLTATPSEQTVIRKSPTTCGRSLKNRATPTPTQEKASACSTARQKFSSSFSTRRFYAPTHASSTASTASCCLKRHFHIPHPDSSPPNCAWPRSCASESTTATA